MASCKWNLLGETKKNAVSKPLKESYPSYMTKNIKGDIFPLTKKRSKNPIWLVREINDKLPDGIVRYICLLSIISNEKKWKRNHKRISWTKIFSKIEINRNLKEKDNRGSGCDLMSRVEYIESLGYLD